ncbi:MAG: hypothetical protein KF878_20285 [Planctomycetes bacterium]|nr:hypothetical protein [Planctomycetota bacterium]
MRNALASVALAFLLATPALARGGPLSDLIVDVAEDAQPVRDVLRRLEQRHGLNYVVSEELLARAGTVTVRLKQVPLDVALESICSAAGLACEVRGPVIVIVPKDPGAPAPLPRVREGVLPERRPPDDPTSDLPPPRANQDDLTAIGKLEEVDLDERRLQLRIDGTKVDFYLPRQGQGADDALSVLRLQQAVSGLKPGARVALLYRRDAGRSVVTALIGGTRPPPARPTSPRPAAAPREDGPRDLRRADAPPPAPVPAPPPVAKAPVDAPPEAEEVPMPEGTLAGRFVGREGEVVRVRRGDGVVVVLTLPPAEQADRRERVLAAVDALEPDGQIFLIYEVVDGAKVIAGTITQSR